MHENELNFKQRNAEIGEKLKFGISYLNTSLNNILKFCANSTGTFSRKGA